MKNLSTEIKIENLKCGSCVKTITKALLKLKGVSEVTVNQPESKVLVNYTDPTVLPKISKKLSSLGYPAFGENNIIKKAISYASCMVGKLD